VVLPAHAAVGGVLHHADDSEVARRVWTSEVRTDGVLPLPEEGLHEDLIDYCDTGRGGAVLRAEAAAHHHMRAYGVEVFRVRPYIRRALIRIRLSLDLDGGVVVKGLHRRVGAESDPGHAGDLVEAVLDRAVESRQLCLRVTRGLGIEVDDVAVGDVELHVKVFELAETLGEHARAHQQHQRERRLHHHQRALQYRSSTCRGA
jgi:hypothetical protein